MQKMPPENSYFHTNMSKLNSARIKRFCVNFHRECTNYLSQKNRIYF